MSESTLLPSTGEITDSGSFPVNPLSDQDSTKDEESNILATIAFPKPEVQDTDEHTVTVPVDNQELSGCSTSNVLAVELSYSMDYVDNISHQNGNCQSDLLSSDSNPASQENISFKKVTPGLSQKETSPEDQNQPRNVQGKGPVLLCRLCAGPCQDSSPVYLFRHPPHHPEVLKMLDCQEEDVVGDILSMIQKTLPIEVSCCDKLPKQVCRTCVESLQLSYAFTTTVLKAESQLKSIRANLKSGEVNSVESLNGSLSTYDCPVCKKKSDPPLSFMGLHARSYGWGDVSIKIEPEDSSEPTNEELERSYNQMFGNQRDFDIVKTEERITLKPLKPPYSIARRPRGRPRSRISKVTPRGRRGRRSMHTTVEKILELENASHNTKNSPEHLYGFELRVNNPASEAEVMCLLCEEFKMGSLECLKHSLNDHTDCGIFLCPRCPRDDFPGDFELIQHYQECHCPELELYELPIYFSQVERSENSASNMFHHETPMETEPQVKQNVGEQCIMKEGKQSTKDTQAMDFENLETLTSCNDVYDGPDEISSNLSAAPRSLTSQSAECQGDSPSISTARPLTSHSVIYEKDSNSSSTHESDTNVASEDPVSTHVIDQHILQDKVMGETSSQCFGDSPCALVIEDFASGMEVESHDNSKIIDGSSFCSPQVEGDVSVAEEEGEGNNFKCLQDDSQDSLRADELCGFQEAITEKSEEVNLNGSSIRFESGIS